MRDIRFRGKRVADGKWTYGYYLVDEQHNKPRHCIWTREFCGTGIANDLIEVDPETVGQSTGLHDKNGKEIHERDVASFAVFDCFGSDTQYTGEVIWNEEAGEFGISSGDNYWNLSWVICQDDEFEVIGNTTDNPDLLKEAK